MSKSVKVCVYGTLKEGYGADHLMRPGVVVHEAAPVRGYKMFSNGSYPMCVPGSPNDTIIGQIWEIPAENLPELDGYEGHPTLFARTPLADYPGVEMYVYQGELEENHSWCKRVKSGIFEKDGTFWDE